MPKDILIAIHQPAFFPWLGFFDKIIRSDIFVILDSVQFPKTGGFWVNRVKILINGNEHWITIPIVRNYSGTRLINEMEINNSTHWYEKLIKTIEVNYKKSSCFNETFPVVKNLLNNDTTSICNYNLAIIYEMCSILEIDTNKIVKSSSLKYEGNATDMLVSITKLAGGNAYMCGGGASKYQEDEKFEQAGIRLLYQDFQHPEYPQFNSKQFIPGLSIIDVMMNIGAEGTKKLLHISGK